MHVKHMLSDVQYYSSYICDLVWYTVIANLWRKKIHGRRKPWCSASQQRSGRVRWRRPRLPLERPALLASSLLKIRLDRCICATTTFPVFKSAMTLAWRFSTISVPLGNVCDLCLFYTQNLVVMVLLYLCGIKFHALQLTLQVSKSEN